MPLTSAIEDWGDSETFEDTLLQHLHVLALTSRLCASTEFGWFAALGRGFYQRFGRGVVVAAPRGGLACCYVPARELEVTVHRGPRPEFPVVVHHVKQYVLTKIMQYSPTTQTLLIVLPDAAAVTNPATAVTPVTRRTEAGWSRVTTRRLGGHLLDVCEVCPACLARRGDRHAGCCWVTVTDDPAGRGVSCVSCGRDAEGEA